MEGRKEGRKEGIACVAGGIVGIARTSKRRSRDSERRSRDKRAAQPRVAWGGGAETIPPATQARKEGRNG